MGFLFWLMAVCTLAASNQPAAEPTGAAKEAVPWGVLELLEGTWEGEIDGKLGQGRGLRRYRFINGKRYLLMRHASVRLPQEKSPAGDYHRELTVFSYDRDRQMIVLREFMEEGFVLQSACRAHAKGLVCEAEAIESGPGMQARLTLTLEHRYRFEERFELAAPGKELELYFTNTWTRVPDLGD